MTRISGSGGNIRSVMPYHSLSMRDMAGKCQEKVKE